MSFMHEPIHLLASQKCLPMQLAEESAIEGGQGVETLVVKRTLPAFEK